MRQMTRAILLTPALIGLTLHPARAEEPFTPPEPVCGEFEYVQEDGGVTARIVTEDCVEADRTRRDTAPAPRRRAGPGPAALGLAVVGVGLALAGAGGGGSSSGKLSPPPPPPKQPLASDMSDPAAWRGAEFRRQYGLGLIGVEHRYAKGATGQGTLGVIYDSGIDLDHYDVGGIRRDLSHSYGDTPDDLSDRDGHGTHVYGIAGARRNGRGIHGVAPDAQFMILKSNVGARPATEILVDFNDALDRSIAAGAVAMNNSWGLVIADPTHPDGRRGGLTRDVPSLDALRATFGPDTLAAVKAVSGTGLSVIFATGNDGASDASIMAGLPHFLPELQDNWIAVTALEDGRSLTTARIADRANRCGAARDWCLAAPGTDILSLGATGPDGLATKSGTSMAAPHVTGAVLVLKSQFPELTPREVHAILFDTAVDLGAPGTDPVYGRGALNLNEALAPQGDLMVELGARVDDRAVPLATSWIAESAITGDALAQALAGHTALVTDRYDRGYAARLGHRVATLPDGISPGAQSRLAAAMIPAITHAPDMPLGVRLDPYGPGFDITRVAHADPVLALTGPGAGFSARISSGDLILRMAHGHTADSTAVSLGLARVFPAGHVFGLTVGRLGERNGVLGATGSGAFGRLRARTLYGRVESDLGLGPRTLLTASVTAAVTDFKGDGLLARGGVDSLGVSLGLTWEDALARGDHLSLALARPFSVSGGDVTLAAGRGISAAEPGGRTNRVHLTRTRVPLGDAQRAPDLHIGYVHRLGDGQSTRMALTFGAVANLSGRPDLAAARAGLTIGF